MVRLARELPWITGICGGWLLLWLYGRAFVLGGTPLGFGWWDYLLLAWRYHHPAMEFFSSWRNPLYPAVVGALGESWGYVVAAQVVASLATATLVLAAGLAGRLLGSAWAGGLAALSLPLVPTVAESSRWLTLYPALAAASGATVVLALLAARTGSRLATLGTGAMLGLAWALDWRGLLFGLPAAILLLLAVIRAPPSRWRRGLPLLFFLGTATSPLLQWSLGSRDILPRTQEVEVQKKVVLRWIRTTHDRELNEACRSTADLGSLSPRGLTGPCARTLVRYNLTHDLRRELPFGLWPTLLLLPLVLLPGRRGWRGTLETGAAVFVPTALLLLLATRVLVPDRYALQFALTTSLVVPVGLARLVQTAVPRRVRAGTEAILLSAATLWLLQEGPPGRNRPTKMALNPDIQKVGPALALLEDRLGPRDRFLDCSGAHVEAALLPRILHDGPPMSKDTDEDRCAAWIADPPQGSGTTWLGTDAGRAPAEDGSWEHVGTVEGGRADFLLWRHRGANGPPAPNPADDAATR